MYTVHGVYHAVHILKSKSALAGYLGIRVCKKFLRCMLRIVYSMCIHMTRRVHSSQRGPDIWIVTDPYLVAYIRRSNPSWWCDLGHDFYRLDSRLYVLLLLLL